MRAEDTIVEDEMQIRQLIKDWTAAQCAKDIDGVMSHYAADVSVFGVTPPLLTQGAASWRSVWEARLHHFPDGFQIEMRDLQIKVSGTVAVAHWLFRFTGADPAMQTSVAHHGRLRETTGPMADRA